MKKSDSRTFDLLKQKVARLATRQPMLLVWLTGLFISSVLFLGCGGPLAGGTVKIQNSSDLYPIDTVTLLADGNAIFRVPVTWSKGIGKFAIDKSAFEVSGKPLPTRLKFTVLEYFDTRIQLHDSLSGSDTVKAISLEDFMSVNCRMSQVLGDRTFWPQSTHAVKLSGETADVDLKRDKKLARKLVVTVSTTSNVLPVPCPSGVVNDGKK